MTKDELLAKAPSGSVGLFNHGDGTVGFYPGGIYLSKRDSLLTLEYVTPSEPDVERCLAYRLPVGEWKWREDKYTEAAKVLESLGYVWNEQAEAWKEPEEVTN